MRTWRWTLIEIVIHFDEPLHKMRKRIAQALPYWNAQEQSVGEIQYEIYSAIALYGPTPFVALAYQNEVSPKNLMGICCAFLNTRRGEMFLQNLIVRTDCTEAFSYQGKLVEHIIDVSQHYGFRGWVSVFPDERNARELMTWKSLGFSRYEEHEPFYRRMGYFVQ